MDHNTRTYYELHFKTQFLESKAAAFQELFVDIMSKAYPEDFIACRPWGAQGDRKNDGYLASEKTLFQVYAPNALRQSETVKKVREDFQGALPYWQKYFEKWVFVHNSRAGLPPEVLATLLELHTLNPGIVVTHWGYEELLLRFKLLSQDSLRSKFGDPPPGAKAKIKSEARKKLNAAQELVRHGKGKEAEKELKEALRLAQEEENEEDEVEVLVALTIMTGDRRGRGDQEHYFTLAERKYVALKSTAAKVIFLRARAKIAQQKRDFKTFEKSLSDALELCEKGEDEKGNLPTQACVIRATLVHHLCSEKRFEEAGIALALCENYALAHAEDEDGELLQAATNAGLHFCLDTGDEAEALLRVKRLEEFAKPSHLANRYGGDLINVANQACQRKAFDVALAAAKASIRLGRREAEMSPDFLAGALYTEAMVLAKSGKDDQALIKAEALVDLCKGYGQEPIKYAAQQLVSEIHRTQGDPAKALELAQRAFDSVVGGAEEVIFAKSALAVTLNDNGRTDEALKLANEAFSAAQSIDIPSRGIVDLGFQVANYSSQLGEYQVADAAIEVIKNVRPLSEDLLKEVKRAEARAGANQKLRQRILEISEPDSAGLDDRQATFQKANEATFAPLVRLWDELKGFDDIACLSSAYDFWGRGNFAQVLLNAKKFERAFNLVIEVRSLKDVESAVRLWGLYADLLILLWKGPTEHGLTMFPFPDYYEAAGGWGYMIALGDTLDVKGTEGDWHPAMGDITTFPEEIMSFLSTEAISFVRAGKLVIVPAACAGCINPGHGPFEQLIAESANAFPNVRRTGREGNPIGVVPYSPDAPIQFIAELAEAESENLRKLRLLLIKRGLEIGMGVPSSHATKLLSMEIDDSLRLIEARSESYVRKRGLARSKEQVSGLPPRMSSYQARSEDHLGQQRHFSPLFMLESQGYGWRVDSNQIPKISSRYQPQDKDMVGAWLAPASPGWMIPTIQQIEESQEGES